MPELIYADKAFSVWSVEKTVPKIVLRIDEPFSAQLAISAGQIRDILESRYPGLVATNPGTEEEPLSNGVTMTPHEIVVWVQYIPNATELANIIHDLQHANEYI